MSAMRATGMTDFAGLRRHRHLGRRHVGCAACRRHWRSRDRTRTRRPAARRRRASTASVIVAQNGCSPWCARCSDHAQVIRLRTSAAWRASSRIVSAGNAGDRGGPVRVLRDAVACPGDSGGTSSKPWQWRAMNASSWRSSTSSVCAIASIMAVSVLGLIGIQRAPRNSGASDLSGLTETNSMPASFACRSQDSSVCSAAAARRHLAVLQRRGRRTRR